MSSIPGGLLPITTTQSPTATSSDLLSLPTPVPSFAWSSFPATLDTCTSATVKWTYSGIPGLIQFILVPQASSRTNAAFVASKRGTGNITLATRVQPTALAWTWPKVNASAGEYVLQASGTWIDVASSSFAINDGADTSCLAAAVTSGTSTTPALQPSDSATSQTTTSVKRPADAGAIAGGAVAGVVAVILALLGCRVWARRRGQQLLRPRSLREAAYREVEPPSPFVTSGTASPASTFSEKNGGGTDPLDQIVTLDSPLSPNRRPPSFLISDPYTPVPPHKSYTSTHGGRAGSITDVSTIGSRTSTALSDATSTAELMRTFSSCPPSYTTMASPPPSYTTDKTRSATTPRSARLSDGSSS